MEKWYFTFGGGQINEGYCQPIIATSYGNARKKMIELYGIEWGFQYSQEEWEKSKNDKNRMWEMEKELPVI